MISTAPGAHATPRLSPSVAPYEERALGFWIYLMSDAIIFALLFSTFVVMRESAAGGPDGKSFFSLSRVFIETITLLFSSFTFGLAFLSSQASNRGGALGWLLATAMLGVLFVGLEIHEFMTLVAAGAGPQRSGFLSAFFTLVGTHGAHVSAGLVGVLTMTAQLLTKGVRPDVLSRLSRLGLFWHFLDIVWIGIFSIVYLPAMI